MIDDSPFDGWPSRVLRQPSWLLGRAAHAGRRLTREELASVELGLLDYLVLATLAEFGTRSQAELVRMLPIDGSDMVAVLTNLERLGLVRRQRDPENARRKLVELTPLGRRRQSRFDTLVDRANERLLAPLTAEEAAILLRLLSKLLGVERGG
jgi:DNA-binding MarR family transcriptional regulator